MAEGSAEVLAHFHVEISRYTRQIDAPVHFNVCVFEGQIIRSAVVVRVHRELSNTSTWRQVVCTLDSQILLSHRNRSFVILQANNLRSRGCIAPSIRCSPRACQGVTTISRLDGFFQGQFDFWNTAFVHCYSHFRWVGIRAALSYVSRNIREYRSIGIVTGVSEGQEHLNGVLLIAFREHLNEDFTAQNTVRRELTHQNFIVVSGQSIRERTSVFIPSHEPSVTKLAFHFNVTAGVEVVSPVGCSRYDLYSRFSSADDAALYTDGHPAVVGQFREEAVESWVDSVWSNIRNQ